MTASSRARANGPTAERLAARVLVGAGQNLFVVETRVRARA